MTTRPSKARTGPSAKTRIARPIPATIDGPSPASATRDAHGVGEPGREPGDDRSGDDEEHEELGHPRRLRSSSVEVLPKTSSMRRA